MPNLNDIELRSVTKRFGSITALDSVGLAVRGGTVHALVGENGAGKSTALKLLSGIEQPSSGTIVHAGREVRLGSRRDAIDAGIGVVAQQLSLIEEFTLAENFILGGSRRLADRHGAGIRLNEAARQAGFEVVTDIPVAQLELAQRQQGELAIALAQGARVLLLDEPTSALGPQQTEKLFDTVRVLAHTGAAVLLITHRIDEVRQIADDVTVLASGAVTLHGSLGEIPDERLVEAMMGDVAKDVVRRSTITPAQRESDRPVLSLTHVRTAGAKGLDDVTFTVGHGEVVGVVGAGGNGQRLLAQVAAGMLPIAGGSVSVNGTAIGGRDRAAARAGVSYVPEARDEGLLPDQEVTHSAILRDLDRPEFTGRTRMLNWRAIGKFTAGLMQRGDVRPRLPSVRAGTLSGGNRQKLLVSRELAARPAVAILHGPTQGLDPRAAESIRRMITDTAGRGTAVLLISADVDEVAALADRILVISAGRIVDELPIADYDLTRIGRAMAGVGTDGA
ncbi:MAG: ATP-binding cassette domain-containing protein [Gordonia sp. (in: high G+C Gram-positive bacteria)]